MTIFLKYLINPIPVFFFVAIVSCEGPVGPAGENGKDANENCIQCHNSGSVLYARQIQAAASVHQTGGNFSRNSAECAPCHTNEGFIEVSVTKAQTSAVPANPSPIGCRTCHKIHEHYDSSDYALRTTSKVTLWMNNQEIDLGNSNLCANCHQPRVVNPMPVKGGADVTITSPRWGVHHSPHAALFSGTGGYEISGSLAYTNSAHTSAISNACVTCHMALPYGAKAGGHTMNISYFNTSGTKVFHTNGCIHCHSNANELAAKINTTQNEIDTLITSLSNLLKARGIISTSGGLKTPQTLSPDLAGIYLNYNMIVEDQSLGIHNYPYIKALLTNSIEYLRAK